MVEDQAFCFTRGRDGAGEKRTGDRRSRQHTRRFDDSKLQADRRSGRDRRVTGSGRRNNAIERRAAINHTDCTHHPARRFGERRRGLEQSWCGTPQGRRCGGERRAAAVDPMPGSGAVQLGERVREVLAAKAEWTRAVEQYTTAKVDADVAFHIYDDLLVRLSKHELWIFEGVVSGHIGA